MQHLQELRYLAGDVPELHLAFFEQLAFFFPTCDILQRRDQRGYFLSAAIVDRSTRAAAAFALIRGRSTRTELQSAADLAHVRANLASEHSTVHVDLYGRFHKEADD